MRSWRYWCILSVFALPSFAEQITLDVAVMLSPNQRVAFHQAFTRFSDESGIQINFIGMQDAEYKRALNRWLIDKKDTPDVIYWQASQRLFHYVQKGVVLPISDIWQRDDLQLHFSHVESSVRYNGEIYAMPFAYYHWGLFYRKSLVSKYGKLPHKWEDFLTLCARLKVDGITPIGIGTRQGWPAAGWFDYINLRMNGLGFHQRLLAGKISFYSPQVRAVLVQWKRLIDEDFFLDGHDKLNWDEPLPLFYRDKIAFTLLGNFVSTSFPDAQKKEIGFMPFPRIKPIPLFEDAPMEVFMIAANTDKPSAAKRLLRFLARPEVQSGLTAKLGYLSPYRSLEVEGDRFTQEGAGLLARVAAVGQFFDRDTLPEFEKMVVPRMADFLNSGDIERLQQQLEAARIKVFKPELQRPD